MLTAQGLAPPLPQKAGQVVLKGSAFKIKDGFDFPAKINGSALVSEAQRVKFATAFSVSSPEDGSASTVTSVRLSCQDKRASSGGLENRSVAPSRSSVPLQATHSKIERAAI
jgi:hypothetical protein